MAKCYSAFKSGYTTKATADCPSPISPVVLLISFYHSLKYVVSPSLKNILSPTVNSQAVTALFVTAVAVLVGVKEIFIFEYPLFGLLAVPG